MSTHNPYEAPKTDIDAPVSSDAAIERLASAQKLVIYSVLAYLGGAALRVVLGPLGLVLLLASLVMGLVGTIRLCTCLGSSTFTKVVLIVLMFIPLVSLVVLLVLNGKATRKLREAGYRVGLLGATR